MYTPEEKGQMAIISIKKYLNKAFTDEEIKEQFSLAIKVLVNNAENIINIKPAGVTSITQGSQSMTFKNGTEAFTITDDVKALLPKPYIRVW